jgi:hypothetical protein
VVLPWTEGDPAGLVVLGILAIVLGWRIAAMPAPDRIPVGRILTLGFAFRATLAVVHGMYPVLPELYSLDAQTYQDQAAVVATAWARGDSPEIEASPVSSLVHVYVLGLLSLVTGTSHLALRAVSAFVGTLSIYYVYLVARQLAGNRSAATIAWLLAAWPSHVFWTSHLFRDAWVFYFLARAVHAAVLWLKRGGGKLLVGTLLFTGGVTAFRFPMGMMLLMAVGMLALLRRGGRGRLLSSLGARLVTLFVLVLGMAVAVSTARFDYEQLLVPEKLTVLRQGLATGRSPIYPDIAFSTWWDVLRFAPVGSALFLLTPFPWQLVSGVHAAAAMENLVLYALLLFGIIRWRVLLKAYGRPEVQFLWLLVGISLFAYGVIEGNVGTAYRHKMQIVPWLVIVLLSVSPGPKKDPGRRPLEAGDHHRALHATDRMWIWRTGH